MMKGRGGVEEAILSLRQGVVDCCCYVSAAEYVIALANPSKHTGHTQKHRKHTHTHTDRS